MCNYTKDFFKFQGKKAKCTFYRDVCGHDWEFGGGGGTRGRAALLKSVFRNINLKLPLYFIKQNGMKTPDEDRV